MAAPTRRWGWHELDTRWASRLVADAEVPSGAWVLDIGAGRGALTGPLVATGARVIAVEAHPDRAAFLRERFREAVVVVQADAGNLRVPRRSFHVVANPPFSIVTALLRRLLQPGSRLCSAHLVVQEQVARRWTSAAAPGVRRWERTFTVVAGPRIPRSAFHPPPHVNTRVIIVRRRPSR